MKRTLAFLFPMVAVMLLLLGGEVRADMASPGSCLGGGSHDEGHDSGSPRGQLSPPNKHGQRRVGVGLLSAAFVTSGWLFFRRQEPKG
jgi:hypothetical protein